MSIDQMPTKTREVKAIVGELEVVEDGALDNAEAWAAWRTLKDAVTRFQALQAKDGSVPEAADHDEASALLATIVDAVEQLRPQFPHDDAYLSALVADLRRWADEGLGVPDFLDSLVEFQPQADRVDGRRHLVLFPMCTQNGSAERHLESVLVEVIWPDFIGELEQTYTNALFVPLRFLDFTSGYDTNSAVLFPETVAMREIPAFTWGAIFQDREAARYRRVIEAAATTTKLQLPEQAQRMLEDQELTEKAFIMWDLLHDRTHMRGDLPFDPFMIKQRMPYFLYSLEELRCDLTAFRQSVEIEKELESIEAAGGELSAVQAETLDQARCVQYAVLLDRIFRFTMTGSRVRNYDGLGGQLMFAWLHQRGVLHWTDTALDIDWAQLPAAVVALGAEIDGLYWRSIDRPKTAHWLAAYDLVASVLTPHPASLWANGLPREILAGPPKGYTDAVLDDEFPLSMFYEELDRKVKPVIESTVGIRAEAA